MAARAPVIRFGPYAADLHTRELRRDGVPIPLQRQPFLILEVLLTYPGELVTREQLRRAIWSDGTYVAFERGLTSAMRKVREALDERADSPVYIETLTGRGYRFLAPVRVDEVRIDKPARAGRWAAQVAAILMISLFESGIGSNTLASARLSAAEELSAYACLLKSQGRFDEGLTAIRKAHAIAPEWARFTAEVGLHLHAVKQYEEEMVMLRRAVAQDPGSPDAWMHLGLGYARRSRFDQAVPALERAHEVSNGQRTQYWLAWARQHQRVALRSQS